MGSKFTNWRWEELTPGPHKMRATWHNLVSIMHHKPQQGGSGTKVDWEVVRKMPTAQRNKFCQEHIMNKKLEVTSDFNSSCASGSSPSPSSQDSVGTHWQASCFLTHSSMAHKWCILYMGLHGASSDTTAVNRISYVHIQKYKYK